MKIVFVDRYGPRSDLHKDPVSIPHALAARGHAVRLVSVEQWRGTLFGLPVDALSDWDNDIGGASPPDAVVAITRFNPVLTPTLRAIKQRGIRLVVKGDTDGTIGFPIVPNYLRARSIARNPLNLLRHLKWRLPLARLVRQRLEHVAMADLTVVESPGAAVNLALLLKHWGAAADIETVRFIPNPVPSSSVWGAPSPTRDKIIIAVGRWDDSVKGADLLRQTIAQTLDVRRDYRFVIVGNAAERVCAALRDEHRARVTCAGELAYAATQEALAAARILLVPSLLESFSFVTAEALCAGASVVVTPLEPLIYLAGGGAYGSIARSFTSDALTAALLREIAVWDSGGRDVDAIAARWRSELDMTTVCDQWERVLAPVDGARESGR